MSEGLKPSDPNLEANRSQRISRRRLGAAIATGGVALFLGVAFGTRKLENNIVSSAEKEAAFNHPAPAVSDLIQAQVYSDDVLSGRTEPDPTRLSQSIRVVNQNEEHLQAVEAIKERKHYGEVGIGSMVSLLGIPVTALGAGLYLDNREPKEDVDLKEDSKSVPTT